MCFRYAVVVAPVVVLKVSIQTKFLNFNLAQINVLKELSSFPFMNMFMPTDILIGL